jgi:uncharacterized protein (DUF1697 family)
MPGPTTYAALLRGINLGARNRVAMADLRKLLEDLGAEDVTTYLQSGNAVLKSSVRSTAKLRKEIEQGISRELGLDITVLLRTGPQLADVLSANPFTAGATDPKTLYVTFLAGAPDPGRVEGIDPSDFEPDEFRVIGEEAHLHFPNGYGQSKLSNAFFEKRLGVAATTRNWNTVTKLAELTGA